MKRLHQILIGTAGVLALAVGTAAAAAPHDDMGHCGMAPGPGMGPGMMHGGHGHGDGDVAAFAAKRLAALKSELKITAQQEAAWQAFAAKAAEQAKAMQAQHQQRLQGLDRPGPAPVSAPERMAQHLDQMRQHLDQMKQHLANMESMQGAVKDLYAVLTPEQRALADQHFEHLHRGGAMGHRMHRG